MNAIIALAMATDETALAIPLRTFIARWLHIRDTLIALQFSVGRADRGSLQDTIDANQEQVSGALWLLHSDTFVTVEKRSLRACRLLLQDTARILELKVFRAARLRVGVFLAAVIDRGTAIGAFSFDWLCEAYLSIPGHGRGTTAGGTTRLIDGKSGARLALQLANVDASAVVQFGSRRTFWRLDDST